MAVNATRGGVQDLGQKLEPVERQMNLLTTRFHDMSVQLPGMRTTMHTIEAAVSPISNDLAELKSGTSDTHAALNTTNDRLDTLSLQFGHIEASLAHLCQHHQVALGSSTLRADASPAQMPEAATPGPGQLAITSGSSGDFRDEPVALGQSGIRTARASKKNKYRSSNLCGCHQSRSRSHMSWSLTEFQYDRCEDHQPSCQLYRYSKKSWMVRARVKLPHVMAKVLELSWTAEIGGGDFRLFSSFEAIRVVDRATSPAFSLFNFDHLADNRCYQLLSKPRFIYGYLDIDGVENAAIQIETSLDNIYQNMFRQFSQGQSSALDQDECGVTLLHVSLAFVKLSDD